MLRIGSNHYELVRVHGGFSVDLTHKSDDVMQREQVWSFEAHFVPAEDKYTLPSHGRPEYLSFSLRSEEYLVADWRQLSGFGLDKEGDHWFGWGSLQNLIREGYKEESWQVIPGWFEVERSQDYLFHCEFFGARRLPDGTEEEMEFKADLPFREATVYVPVNAADPTATARTMAARAVKLTALAGSDVLRYDPTRQSWLNAHINSHHRVTLQTPWRSELV